MADAPYWLKRVGIMTLDVNHRLAVYPRLHSSTHSQTASMATHLGSVGFSNKQIHATMTALLVHDTAKRPLTAPRNIRPEKYHKPNCH